MEEKYLKITFVSDNNIAVETKNLSSYETFKLLIGVLDSLVDQVSLSKEELTKLDVQYKNLC
jgi:hypothetical protein